MAVHPIWLKGLRERRNRVWKNRQYRHGLICFFDSLSLFLRAGYSLGYSWPETLKSLDGLLASEVRDDLQGGMKVLSEEWEVAETLNQLATSCRIEPYRLWFALILKLYENGAQLIRGVEAVTTALRREQERDFEAHCRSLPTKVNIILMLFFLPPTFLWLFIPLVLEILAQFK